MRDRWDTETRVIDVAAPTNKIVMTQTGQATGDLNSQHRVTEHPAGFRIRERGALDGYVVHQYRCPVHGTFDARVDRAHMPEEVACPAMDLLDPSDVCGALAGVACVRECSEYSGADVTHSRCGLTAPWAGSLCGQGWSSGECKS